MGSVANDSGRPRVLARGIEIALLAFALLCVLPPAAAAENWELARRVPAGSMPWSVTVSADGANLWVSMVGLKDRDNVWRFDSKSLQVQARSSFVGHAVESALIADGERLLVTNSRKDLLMELDSMSLRVLRRIDTDRTPKDFAVSADERTAYVANYGAGTVSAVRLADGRARHLRTGRHARGATLGPEGKELYVMNFGAGTVSVVDTETFASLARISACRKPRHAVAVGDNLLVTCYGAHHVLVIDRRTYEIRRRLVVGSGPKTITLSPDARVAVTANEKGNSLSFIDTRSWEVQTQAVPGRKPCGVSFAPDGTRLYVTARGSHEILELVQSQ